MQPAGLELQLDYYETLIVGNQEVITLNTHRGTESDTEAWPRSSELELNGYNRVCGRVNAWCGQTEGSFVADRKIGRAN